MAAQKIEKKMKEKGAAEKKNGRAESFSPKIYCEFVAFLQTLTPAYIMLRSREVTKKPKPKATTRDKFGRKPKRDQNVKK